jgi:hypothetical protein
MAAVDVRVSGQSVDVQATNAPIAEVLDRLSRQTHMKVVYDGAPPRQMVTLDLRGRTPVEAVTAALEGQGVNYALSMDPSGTRVETLLVSGTASAGASRPGSEERRTFAREIPQESIPQEEPETVVEEDAGAPADTSAGIAASQGRESGVAAEVPQTPPVETGLGGFSASPFAPQAPAPQPPAGSAPSTKGDQPPQPQATPPPFNP